MNEKKKKQGDARTMKREKVIPSCKSFARPKQLNDIGKANDMLERATVSLQNDKPVATTFESLYNSVADLLAPQFAKHLCQRLDNLIDNHTKSVLNQFRDNDLEQMHFLKQLNECWKNNSRQLQMIRGIFLYLDRKYVLTDTTIMSIWDLGIDKFRFHFMNSPVTKNRTISGLLNLIEQERRGALIDRALVKDLLNMMSCLSIYRSTFEPDFLSETKRLYKQESQRRVNDDDLPEYLDYVDRIIKEETERSMYYLESITQVPLIETIEYQLISQHLDFMLTKGLDQLLDDMRIEELKLLHSLTSRVSDGPQELCTHFNKHVKKRGLVIVENVVKDKTMVQDLLIFKEKMDRVVTECFGGQMRFINSLKEAFEHFINKRPNKPAELIAKYIDLKLKTGNKEATEDELEKILDKILVLFRFIHGKDVFEAFYKKDLAKRLLVNKSASVDAEKSMLSKLKQECGAAFTGKLEGMFKDIDLSRDLMENYKSWLQNHNIATVDINVSVLTMGYWPTYQPLKVILPEFMQRQQTLFEKFYTTKHNGRKLQWQPNLGQCTLIAMFQSKHKHELKGSLFQALVLLLFMNCDELGYKEILEKTNIEPIELKRTLQSLACGKLFCRILTKEPKGKDIEDDDKFIYNSKFQSQLYKIRINQVQLKETQEEQSMTEERVFQDRQYQIDAAIVRIMKTRRKLSHNALISEVFEHLRFPVRGHDVKVRIESLIERDYLNRDQEDSSLYNYVA